MKSLLEMAEAAESAKQAETDKSAPDPTPEQGKEALASQAVGYICPICGGISCQKCEANP